jgi:hypothetical protein
VGAYSGFGTVATLLEMIPFASIVFSFTNTGKSHKPLGESVMQPMRTLLTPLAVVGAALWAADIEKKESEMSSSTAPGLRDAAKKAE